jgi:hypothetical protein
MMDERKEGRVLVAPTIRIAFKRRGVSIVCPT